MLAAGHPVDVADNRGWQPLHDATAGNYTNCLELLLQNGLYCIYNVSITSKSHIYMY